MIKKIFLFVHNDTNANLGTFISYEQMGAQTGTFEHSYLYSSYSPMYRHNFYLTNDLKSNFGNGAFRIGSTPFFVVVLI